MYGTNNGTIFSTKVVSINKLKIMKLNEDIKPITYLKTNSADLILEVQKSKRPIIITQNGEAKAVIQDLNEFQKQQDLIALLKAIAIGEQEIKNKDLVDQDKLFHRLDNKLKK